MKTIRISVEAPSPYDHHKLIITPSVAVNPPGIQFFKGINHEWTGGKLIEHDNRVEQMSAFIITMLSSKDYPNAPITTKATATKIAKTYLPGLIENIKYTTNASVIIRK